MTTSIISSHFFSTFHANRLATIVYVALAFAWTASQTAAEDIIIDPLSEPRNSPVELSISLEESERGGGLLDAVTHWSGFGLLQRVNQVDGRWRTVAIGSPYRNIVIEGSKFYRVIGGQSWPTSVHVPTSWFTLCNSTNPPANTTINGCS